MDLLGQDDAPGLASQGWRAGQRKLPGAITRQLTLPGSPTTSQQRITTVSPWALS